MPCPSLVRVNLVRSNLRAVCAAAVAIARSTRLCVLRSIMFCVANLLPQGLLSVSCACHPLKSSAPIVALHLLDLSRGARRESFIFFLFRGAPSLLLSIYPPDAVPRPQCLSPSISSSHPVPPLSCVALSRNQQPENQNMNTLLLPSTLQVDAHKSMGWHILPPLSWHSFLWQEPDKPRAIQVAFASSLSPPSTSARHSEVRPSPFFVVAAWLRRAAGCARAGRIWSRRSTRRFRTARWRLVIGVALPPDLDTARCLRARWTTVVLDGCWRLMRSVARGLVVFASKATLCCLLFTAE